MASWPRARSGARRVRLPSTHRSPGRPRLRFRRRSSRPRHRRYPHPRHRPLPTRRPWAHAVPMIPTSPGAPPPSPSAARTRRAWASADLMRRVFALEVLACASCGGRRRFIATIEDSPVVAKILAHLGRPTAGAGRRAGAATTETHRVRLCLIFSLAIFSPASDGAGRRHWPRYVLTVRSGPCQRYPAPAGPASEPACLRVANGSSRQRQTAEIM